MNIFNIYKKPIGDIKEYIEREYGEEILDIKKSLIEIPKIKNRNFEGKNNCSLVSISRLMNYYSFENEEEFLRDIYELVYKNRYMKGYHPRVGTFPLFFSHIFNRSLNSFNIKNIRLKTHFSLNFNKIRENIDKKRPLMLSFYTGYYKRHTVVCNGYLLVKTNKMVRNFLIIVDGWKDEYRYIDCGRINKFLVIGHSLRGDDKD